MEKIFCNDQFYITYIFIRILKQAGAELGQTGVLLDFRFVAFS